MYLYPKVNHQTHIQLPIHYALMRLGALIKLFLSHLHSAGDNGRTVKPVSKTT